LSYVVPVLSAGIYRANRPNVDLDAKQSRFCIGYRHEYSKCDMRAATSVQGSPPAAWQPLWARESPASSRICAPEPEKPATHPQKVQRVAKQIAFPILAKPYRPGQTANGFTRVDAPQVQSDRTAARSTSRTSPVLPGAYRRGSPGRSASMQPNLRRPRRLTRSKPRETT